MGENRDSIAEIREILRGISEEMRLLKDKLEMQDIQLWELMNKLDRILQVIDKSGESESAGGGAKVS